VNFTFTKHHGRPRHLHQLGFGELVFFCLSVNILQGVSGGMVNVSGCDRKSFVFPSYLLVRRFMRNIQTAVPPHPFKIGHVNMNSFTWNNPYYHLLKYLLFLLKQPVYYGYKISGFGGLVAFGTQDCRFEPGRRSLIFRAKKPQHAFLRRGKSCLSHVADFAACKRTL
jgi:hypothetical protein